MKLIDEKVIVYMNLLDSSLESKALLQEITFPGLNVSTKIFMKRIDLIHSEISGNKWFKLKHNLAYAVERGYKKLLTFGGAYSNHIHATAAAGKMLGFETIGVIRGEKHLPLNPTLQSVSDDGMKLIYVNRSDYRKKHMPEFHKMLEERFGNVYILPEGGTNLLAVKGCTEIPDLIETDYDYLCTACGTAGTVSGLIAGMNGRKNILGFSVLRGGAFLIKQAQKLVKEYSGNQYLNWSINLEYHFGGYAKINRELVLFINEFEKLNGISLDPVYTGKMMFGIYDLLKKNFFKKGATIVALHTGGLQGATGMKSKMEKLTSLNI